MVCVWFPRLVQWIGSFCGVLPVVGNGLHRRKCRQAKQRRRNLGWSGRDAMRAKHKTAHDPGRLKPSQGPLGLRGPRAPSPPYLSLPFLS